MLAAKTACLTTFAEHFQQAGHASTVSGGNVGFSCDVTVNEYQSDTTLLLSCLTEAGVLSSDCAAAFAPASAQCADGGS